MKSTQATSIAILVVGVLLLAWGLSANQAFTSELSRLLHGAPSDKSVLLIALGAVVTVAGLAGVARRG